MSETYKDYTIVKGDNLTKIAKQFGTTVDELVKINNIANPNLIYAGANLKIPVAQTAEQTKEADKTAAAVDKLKAAKAAAEKKAAQEATKEKTEEKESLIEKIADKLKGNK